MIRVASAIFLFSAALAAAQDNAAPAGPAPVRPPSACSDIDSPDVRLRCYDVENNRPSGAWSGPADINIGEWRGQIEPDQTTATINADLSISGNDLPNALGRVPGSFAQPKGFSADVYIACKNRETSVAFLFFGTRQVQIDAEIPISTLVRFDGNPPETIRFTPYFYEVGFGRFLTLAAAPVIDRMLAARQMTISFHDKAGILRRAEFNVTNLAEAMFAASPNSCGWQNWGE